MTRRVTSSELVGRRDELALIGGRLDGLTSDGVGGVLLITGEAGVGKSRLVEALTELAHDRQVQVLVGRCVQFGHAVRPAAPLIDILSELSATLDEGDVEFVIGPAQQDLGGLIPSLNSRLSKAEPLETAQLFELVHGVLRRRVELGPVVLVIEDLHWADRTTSDFVGYLALRMHKEPLLFVATYRSDEIPPQHPLLAVLAELQRAVRPERLDLIPFDAKNTAELVSAIGGHDLDEAAVEILHRRSGGNAFYIEELLTLTDQSQPVPATLREVVLGRSQMLSDEALAILRVASITGSRVQESILCRLIEFDSSSVNAGLHELVNCHFLVEDDGYFGFRHDLTREVFAEELLSAERADLHGHIARTMQECAPKQFGEIAHHWYHSGNQPEALQTAITAAETANRAGATAEALLNLERVLELWNYVPAPDRQTRLSHADILLQTAHAANVLQEYQHSVDLAQQACDELAEADNLTRALALRELSIWQWDLGEPGIDQTVDLAMDLIKSEPPSAGVAQVLARAANMDMLRGRYEQSLERCDLALEMARAANDQNTEANLMNTMAVDRYCQNVPGAIDELWTATNLAVEVGDVREAVRCYINLSELLHFDGRHVEAVATALEGLRYLEQQHHRECHGAPLVENASKGLEALGRWDELDELSEQVVAWRQLDLSVPAPSGLAVAARVMVKRGDTQRARPLLEHDLKAELTLYSVGNAGVLVSGLLELDLIEGRPAPDPEVIDCAIYLVTLRRDIRLVEVMTIALRGEADAATAASYQKDKVAVTRARDRANRWISHVERRNTEVADVPNPLDLEAMITLCHAEYRRAYDNNEPQNWCAVVAEWEQLKQPWPTAYAQWRYAESLLLARDHQPNERTLVQRLLRAAHTTATRLGAKPLLTDIQDLATRARIDLTEPPPAEPEQAAAVPFNLTPRELNVLELVAEGYSNGRIGKELFISTKTASVHVSHILRKLNASNRIEAAAIAIKTGITK